MSLPTPHYAGWAHQLRDDRSAAHVAFESARTLLDSAITQLPDDWRVHAWLRQSTVYREDALHGPLVAEDRARILAQVGDAHLVAANQD